VLNEKATGSRRDVCHPSLTLLMTHRPREHGISRSFSPAHRGEKVPKADETPAAALRRGRPPRTKIPPPVPRASVRSLRQLNPRQQAGAMTGPGEASLEQAHSAAQTPPTQPLPPPPCARTAETAFTSFEDQPRIAQNRQRAWEKEREARNLTRRGVEREMLFPIPLSLSQPMVAAKSNI
jgi:hypothetical protein